MDPLYTRTMLSGGCVTHRPAPVLARRISYCDGRDARCTRTHGACCWSCGWADQWARASISLSRYPPKFSCISGEVVHQHGPWNTCFWPTIPMVGKAPAGALFTAAYHIPNAVSHAPFTPSELSRGEILPKRKSACSRAPVKGHVRSLLNTARECG
ncbi:hypothetical protein VUR80DRAFT_5653 [Thermomyces stellatus]